MCPSRLISIGAEKAAPNCEAMPSEPIPSSSGIKIIGPNTHHTVEQTEHHSLAVGATETTEYKPEQGTDDNAVEHVVDEADYRRLATHDAGDHGKHSHHRHQGSKGQTANDAAYDPCQQPLRPGDSRAHPAFSLRRRSHTPYTSYLLPWTFPTWVLSPFPSVLLSRVGP